MARQKLPGPGKLRRRRLQMRGRMRRILWRDPCFEPCMPTSPSLLDLKPPRMPPSGPAHAKPPVPGPAAATDFRRALAAIPPVSADRPKAATAEAAPALLPQRPAIPAPVVAEVFQKISSIAQNSGAAKRLKKALAQAPAATASAAAALPLSAAVAASATPLGAARPDAARPDAARPDAARPDAARPGAAPRTGNPAPPAAVFAARAADPSAAPPPSLPSLAISAAVPAKPDLVTSTNNAKQAAAPEKTGLMPTVAAHIQPDHVPPAAAGPPPASHGPAKSAGLTRQIAAALPRSGWTNPGNSPLHISLTPATLGTITIKIAQHASGATTVTLTASQPETLAALKQDARHLDQVLTNAGIPEQDRQVDFQTMPVAATQSSPGLGNAGGQPAGGQPAGGQLPGGLPTGGFAGGQFGPGNGNAQQQQAGTAFAHPTLRPVAARAVESVARPISNRAGSGVDVIA